jgi:multiple sugar transport system permease protein
MILFRALPKELEEGVLSDGCSQLDAFLRTALPMVVSGILASAIFCIILAWNNFLFEAFLSAADTKPLSGALLSLYGTKDITWGTMGGSGALSGAADRRRHAAPQPLLR